MKMLEPLEPNADELRVLMRSLAELTLASFAPPAPASSPAPAAPQTARQSPPRAARPGGNLPGNLNDPRVLEALAQLRNRPPRILNSHYRPTPPPGENAKIHFPRKTHG